MGVFPVIIHISMGFLYFRATPMAMETPLARLRHQGPAGVGVEHGDAHGHVAPTHGAHQVDAHDLRVRPAELSC